MRQKSLFDGAAVSIFCFFCTRPALSAENSFLFMSILSKDLHPSAAAAPFRSAAPLLCGRTVPVYALPPRKAPGMGCSHPTSNFTTLCKKKTASAFLHADGSGGDGGFSRALKTAHWAVLARRDAKRRARAVLIPPATSLNCAKRKPPALFFTLAALAEMVGFEPTCPVKDKTISSL